MTSSCSSRRGMSVVEFIGCLSAMVGGVVLGSMYLGVDVKRMGVAMLQQANLIDAGEKKQAAATQVEVAPPTPVTATAAPVASTSAGETAGPATEETAVAPAPQNDAVVEQTPAPASEAAPAAEPAPAAAPAAGPLAGFLSREDLIDLTDEQRNQLTRAYWEALDNCTKQEAKHRIAGLPEDGNWQLFDYLTCRKKGHEEAVGFISQLNLRGVDDHVTSYAEKALAWHRDGVKLFSRALDLLTDAPSAQLSGPFAQSLQSAATQHQMEERLLRDKHNAVQAYLDHSLTAEPAPADAAAAVQPAEAASTP